MINSQRELPQLMISAGWRQVQIQRHVFQMEISVLSCFVEIPRLMDVFPTGQLLRELLVELVMAFALMANV